MKVLLVSHDFLPSHPAGVEIYTYQFGKALQARGHDVQVFTTEKDIGRENLSVEVRDEGGLPVHELFNNLYYNDFVETYDYPAAARSFGVLLDDFKPDVVHFMHLMYLSVACVEEVNKRKIPVYYTLHDYWLQCAWFGQRRFLDGSICHEIDFEKCGICLKNFKYKQTKLERAGGKAIASVRSKTGVDLGGIARSLQRGFKIRAAKAESPNSKATRRQALADDWRSGITPETSAIAKQVEIRAENLYRRILPGVDRFIAPSQFLRTKFLEWGIPEEQIDHMRTGIDLEMFQGHQSKPAKHLRVTFIGTIAPHKGVHLLLQAWQRIEPSVRGEATLRIFGPPSHNPTYVSKLENLSLACGATLEGRLAREAVSDALAETDILVVPSIWYENSPLIILEALATKTPLIVSDLGGMAELVEPGRTGFHFEMGSSEDLERVLRDCLGNPAQLDDLYGEDVIVRNVTEDAEDMETSYRAEIRARVEAENSPL
ncbi:MAG: glycosyltransferase involved in cell wall biosynthesis [Planctomycetota bacterium]